MWCMYAGDRAELRMQMHVVVIRPLSKASEGRISCRPMGMEPIRFEWTGPRGNVETDASGSEAIHVSVGRYRVRATDANGERADVCVDVTPLCDSAVVVNEYRILASPSTGHSRDGRIEALGSGFEAGMQFLWTHGVVTTTPVLNDVPCGTYALTAMSDGGDAPAVTVHACNPAVLRV